MSLVEPRYGGIAPNTSFLWRDQRSIQNLIYEATLFEERRSAPATARRSSRNLRARPIRPAVAASAALPILCSTSPRTPVSKALDLAASRTRTAKRAMKSQARAMITELTMKSSPT